MKGYTVFNVEQIEGLPAHYHAKAEPRLDPCSASTARKHFSRRQAPISATAAIMAYYNIGADYVQMPPFEAFRDAESYYATLAHE